MITFLLGMLVGIVIGVGGTFAVLIIRARTLVKRFMKEMQGGDPHED